MGCALSRGDRLQAESVTVCERSDLGQPYLLSESQSLGVDVLTLKESVVGGIRSGAVVTGGRYVADAREGPVVGGVAYGESRQDYLKSSAGLCQELDWGAPGSPRVTFVCHLGKGARGPRPPVVPDLMDSDGDVFLDQEVRNWDDRLGTTRLGCRSVCQSIRNRVR